MQTRREITRKATVREIKSTTLALMRTSGTVDIRLADIAREMRMSAPGLYRYFDGRDDLLTALITDAFTDLAEQVEQARDAVPAGDVGARFLAVCRAYRSWALAEPQRFALVFGPPVPGYAAPEEGPTSQAAKRAMAAFKGLVAEAERFGVLGPPRVPTVPEEVARGLDEGDGIPPATAQGLMHSWAGLHGFVSLEAFHTFDFCGPAARDGMFVGLVRLLADACGFPPPRAGWVYCPTGSGPIVSSPTAPARPAAAAARRSAER